MKKALITGITGQDGAYLGRFLLEKGYQVFGAFRRSSGHHHERLEFLGVDEIEYVPVELLEFTNIHRTIERVAPDEIYNLGSQSSVPTSFEEPLFTTEVTGLGILRILEAVRVVAPSIRVYQASSSEMFGSSSPVPQTEASPFHPKSPYAVSKAFAHWCAVNYREAYDLFVACGILFNHESPLRGLDFVTRKVTHSVARIASGLQQELRLGNLDSSRDWGYAPEYVEAMWLMLQQPVPDDFVIATGKAHTVRDFVNAAFRAVDAELEWTGTGPDEIGIDCKTGRTLVRVDSALFRPADPEYLVGDASKAAKAMGWSARTPFEELVRLMVEHDLTLVSRRLSP